MAAFPDVSASLKRLAHVEEPTQPIKADVISGARRGCRIMPSKATAVARMATLAVLAGARVEAQGPTQVPLPVPFSARTEPAPSAIPAPIYSITLHTRQACVTPHCKLRARVDGGLIDVVTPTPQGIVVSMTGAAAANSCLGCTGSAVAEFELVQEFEIVCSDPRVNAVALTLDSTLVGFVRSKGHAAASMRLAEVSVTPEGWDGTCLSLSYPPFGVTGKGGRSCSQHVPPVQDVPMPLGPYILAARFVLDAEAGGVCADHSAADFSPDTVLPAEWVRLRDPFQGVSKRNFGFTFILTAAAPSATVHPITSRLPGSGIFSPSNPTGSARTFVAAKSTSTKG
jgi:hypothetical protein